MSTQVSSKLLCRLFCSWLVQPLSFQQAIVGGPCELFRNSWSFKKNSCQFGSKVQSFHQIWHGPWLCYSFHSFPLGSMCSRTRARDAVLESHGLVGPVDPVEHEVRHWPRGAVLSPQGKLGCCTLPPIMVGSGWTWKMGVSPILVSFQDYFSGETMIMGERVWFGSWQY